jgi:hypothetical protein
MGNPAEKTIRNPNLTTFLSKVQMIVNGNLILQQFFFRSWGERWKLACKECLH